MVRDQVVAVHSGSTDDGKLNLATPVEQTRKITKVFYMTNQNNRYPLLPKGVKDKGEVHGLTYPGQNMRVFV
ncbi:hypothetical protein RRF57_009145 [Xylaria bambusicola]|uniref:Uncharacterized protein n=1 Tax=Xylaria bambusicola TaxID=326684 RepID=A0AAN7UWE7_9PEZI